MRGAAIKPQQPSRARNPVKLHPQKEQRIKEQRPHPIKNPARAPPQAITRKSRTPPLLHRRARLRALKSTRTMLPCTKSLQLNDENYQRISLRTCVLIAFTCKLLIQSLPRVMQMCARREEANKFNVSGQPLEAWDGRSVQDVCDERREPRRGTA
jgi:hypothetical protein